MQGGDGNKCGASCVQLHHDLEAPSSVCCGHDKKCQQVDAGARVLATCAKTAALVYIHSLCPSSLVNVSKSSGLRPWHARMRPGICRQQRYPLPRNMAEPLAVSKTDRSLLAHDAAKLVAEEIFYVVHDGGPQLRLGRDDGDVLRNIPARS